MDFITKLFDVEYTPVEHNADYNNNSEKYLKKKADQHRKKVEEHQKRMSEYYSRLKRYRIEEIQQDFGDSILYTNFRKPNMSKIKVVCVLGVVIAIVNVTISKIYYY